MEDTFNKIVALCKRRGFVYPGSEIYGGLANTYDYGPRGVELLRNIKNRWWDHFVTRREDMYGLDTNILMNPKVWEASGHTASFSDVVVDCRNCQFRTRADHLIEDYLDKNNPDEIDFGSYQTKRLSEEKVKTLIKTHKVEGYSEEELDEIINALNIPCTICSGNEGNKWTPTRKFNLLFETHIGIVSEEKSLAYLRGEIAQGMFVNFKNVLDTISPKLPFGLAQSGAAFRNEVTMGKFTFRTLQFNLAEFEYFFNPENMKWEELFEKWKEEMWKWTTDILQLKTENLRWRPHTDEERSHYSTRTEDVEYKFPFGFKELYGLAYRTDFDLKNHREKSGVDLRYTDPQTGNKFIPHVIEPTFGMDRTFLAVLFNSYHEDETNGKKRVVISLPTYLAPYKAAVFPLVANKPEITSKARNVFELLKKNVATVWDDRGNIGKRYFAQDEIGTPNCITVDYQTLEDDTVTVRDRDSMKQERVVIEKLPTFIQNKSSTT
ncbi:glycine--tRNA ligase [Candidatus Roizmanbacteria bacterium]|nr:glycine--tRNA ligase [Candidatus Roizmanbacteria bacterium]